MKHSLSDVPVNRVSAAQQAAQMRLQLYMIGKTHELFGQLAERAWLILDRAADNDGKLDSVGFYTAQSEIEQAWAETFGAWKTLFSGLRVQAGSLPFGTLAVLFGKFAGGYRETLESRRQQGLESHRWRGVAFEEQEEWNAVYDPQLQAILAAAAERLYGDGFNLSQRIWRLDQESLNAIRQILAEGIAAGDSAWQIARRLEGLLGAGRECPRWTSTRLYRLTKGDIASGNRTGLYSGDECAGQGISYNALRLARNELQIVHALATDEVMRHSPWVEKEKINLSPAHPQIGCDCESTVAGGENGDGVYPVGTVILPIHVQCSPPGQLVSTSDGQKPIETVKAGDEVLTDQERMKRVIETMDRPFSGDLVQITTKAGKVVRLTPEHPVLVNGEWKLAKDVRVGDLVQVV